MCRRIITNHFNYNLDRAGKINRKGYVGSNGGGVLWLLCRLVRYLECSNLLNEDGRRDVGNGIVN